MITGILHVGLDIPFHLKHDPTKDQSYHASTHIFVFTLRDRVWVALVILL